MGTRTVLLLVITRGGLTAKGGTFGARTAIVVRDNKGRATAEGGVEDENRGDDPTNGGWTE